jgi:hypothetical protein
MPLHTACCCCNWFLPAQKAAPVFAELQRAFYSAVRRCSGQTRSCCPLPYSLRLTLLVVFFLQDAAAAAWVAGPASALLAAAAGDARLLRFRGSDVAAVALALGRDAAGAAPPWPLCLASLTCHAVSSGFWAVQG